MRKLKLDVDALAVESFETAKTAGHTGTVQGRVQAPATDPKNDTTRLWSCEATCITCTDCNTCISCQATCFDVTCATCGGESCGATMCRATFPDNCCA
jgi:hypothetical protein